MSVPDGHAGTVDRLERVSSRTAGRDASLVAGGGVRRIRLGVHGTVQGVGFRPFVYRLATGLGLAGSVWNDGSGVHIEVEGRAEALDALIECLRTGAPRLARVEDVRVRSLPPDGERGFTIRASDATRPSSTQIGPDVAPCDACLEEVFDPRDRRFRYPFVNCTDCGPRYTIVRSLPYDRSRTTMAAFEMCSACRAEYEDPRDRRFHAQPNACPACGPRVRLVGMASEGAADAIAVAAGALLAGAIVAVKGVGGYHLACRADDARVVRRLRSRKRRAAKPFALMVSDVDAALRVVSASREEIDLLTSAARPIVLARRRADAPVAADVAPRHRDLGVMLPSTPLHHLLTRDAAVPLVMTSGNLSDEPTLHVDDEAMEALSGVADLFLAHDRAIAARADDSVARIVDIQGRRRRLTIRRARGYVPEPVELPCDGPDVLATGADLKSAACVTRGRRAWVAPCLGDLEHWETLCAYRAEVPRLAALACAAPVVIAHDLHPRYASTTYALEDRADLEAVAVQHHHAHLAACLVELRRNQTVLGAILDGTGYGPDRTAWGGELLLGDLDGYRRVGHLLPVALPGGDAAVRQPWRMACAWLAAAGRPAAYVPTPLAPAVQATRWRAVRRLVEREEGVPRTSSAGRLFDAVSALCGLCAEASYEGQAAIELEAAASTSRGPVDPYPITLRWSSEGRLVVDPRRAIRAVARDADRGRARGRVAGDFHEGFARALVRALRVLARRHGVDAVVLSGGVFQNVLLLERVCELLAGARLEPLVPEAFPVNDGGVSLGQAAVALAVPAVRERASRQPGAAPAP